MPNIKIFKQTGEEAGTMALSDKVFGQEYNEPLIHQVVVAQLANRRQGTKCTLTRSEVRGGGKKPWRQKHTGKARQGSTRAPQWIKGGVVFAPKPRDFSQKVNKQAKEIALFSALSTKVAHNEFVVLDDLTLKNLKTKEVAAVLEKLKLEESVLLILPAGKENIYRASKNLANVTTIQSNLINVYDIARHTKCLALKSAVQNIEEAYKD